MSSKLLVLNAGSSSLKYKLFDEAAGQLRATVGGVVERIGDLSNSTLVATSADDSGGKQTHKAPVADHTTALSAVLDLLQLGQSDVAAVGHRVVHGKSIASARLVTQDVISAIEDASDLAPLHNPANLQGIRAAQRAFPGTPSVAVFDTAWHQSMPARAYSYAIPAGLARKHQLRRYGAHGTSVRFLVQRAAQALGMPESEVNLIVAHIGAGASMTAIEGGRTLDTSMGLTPLEGLVMGTRCGDIDPSLVLYLQRHCGLSAAAADALLNKESGFKGLAGQADLRAVAAAAEGGSEEAALALQVYVWRLRKYLGAYLVHLKGRVDAIVFSAGIGENSPLIRSAALADLQAFGIAVDESANARTVGGVAGPIHATGAAVRVLVIPTDEELSIAQQTLEVLRSGSARA